MRRIVAVGIGVVLAVALLAWKSCGSSSKHTSAANGGSAAHSTTLGAHRAKDGPAQPASLAGKVTRASSGAPVPNAVVSLAPAELMAMFMKSDMPTLVAVTDANGAWKVPRVMPGSYVAAATASGYLPGDGGKVTVAAGEQRDGVNLVLTAGGTIVHGTVTDVGGGPIGDARITATKGQIPDLSGHADLVTTTKSDGTYELTLPDGSFELDAAHDDYTHARKRIELAGKPITTDFSLIPGAIIRGQVVARDSGKPVPGALIRAEGGHGSRGDGSTAMSDDNGNFQMRSLGSGTIELSALGRGYATSSPTAVDVGIGEQVEGVRVLVDRAYSISGKVVRKGKPDEPLAGITLGAFSIAAKAFGIALEPSAKDGSFEIVGVKPAAYMLFAVGEGAVPEVGKTVEVVDKDVEGVVVEISAGVTVAGHVEPPMVSAQISLELAGQVGIANMFDAAKLMLVHGETDASGAFTLNNVPSGAFKVKAMAPSGHAGEQPVVVAEADVSGVTVKLEARASVSGRVLDSNGAPVAGGRVNVDSLGEDRNMSISFGPGDRSSATTATDGTFKVVGLEPGKVRVRARDPSTPASGRSAARCSPATASLHPMPGSPRSACRRTKMRTCPSARRAGWAAITRRC
ncbi:MAG: hypothetical protein H6Q90_3633 [Deltaproteobacteria bacterium]|nr:hypothetical protein [Deltaproteobacteria bacterium]